ncbi:MAG: hypothetical protein AAGA44_15855 [Pseudomonadota bacterium]
MDIDGSSKESTVLMRSNHLIRYWRACRRGLPLSLALLACAACSTIDPYDPFDSPSVEMLDWSAIYFDCGALPGRFSLAKQPLHGRVAEVSGVFRIINRRHHPDWVPGVTVNLRDEADKVLIGASMGDIFSDGNLEGQVLGVSQKEVQRQSIGRTFQVLESVEFTISVSPDRSVGTVQIGDRKSAFIVPLDGEPTSLTMSCNSSWSEFNLEDIEYYDTDVEDSKESEVQSLLDAIVYFVPIFANGEPYGFRLYPAESPSDFVALGLRSGDVLIAVGKRDITDHESALTQLNTVSVDNPVRLTLVRGGQNVELELPVPGESNDLNTL